MKNRREMIELLLNFALALEKLVHIIVGHGLGEFGVDLFELLQQLDGFLNGLLYDLTDGSAIVDQRLLFEIADGIAGRQHGLAVDLLVHTGHDAQQRGFTRPVETDDADLGAVKIRKIDIFEDGALVVVLADADHRVNNFIGFYGHELKP